jgi:hypothetical protein
MSLSVQTRTVPIQRSENLVVVNVSSGLGSFWAVTNPDR